jgi:hypothetical protein
MAGVRLLELELSDMLDVLYHLMVEDEVPHAKVQVSDDRVELYHRARVRADIDEQLDGATPPEGLGDPETWGTLPEHQSAMQSMMAFAGAPAPPRAGGG